MEEDEGNRRKLIERIKREVSSNTYKIKSGEIAEKIGQRLKEDIPITGLSKKV